ncbi:OpgC family protein [Rhizobium grahamii]|uniref:OpgC protein n=1 Tax=Rhizobium grahamii TaxID=1120045 RepID=A0A370KK92_9HYPH|nr:OpgC domain-containing protein [Rhizobium grahamii]RDJ07862.1 OpgC protein [Rhizobium grahamii]
MPHPAPQSAGRDPRLDFFRGVALVMIFINHVPGNFLEGITSKNFGFSDAAEAFVLMSGMSAGLAYSSAYGRDAMMATGRILRRARHLYGVHLATTVIAVAILMTGHHFLATDTLSDRVNLGSYLDAPWKTAAGFVAMTHQLGYFNILPLYIVLIAATPIFLAIASISRPALIAVSVGIWGMAGCFNINLPNFPAEGMWFLNPFSWQLIFCIGLCAGMASKKQESFVGYNPTLMAASLAYLAFSLFVIEGQHYELTDWGDHPAFLVGFDKGILPLPRLLHILALAYVVSQLPACGRIAANARLGALTLLGKHGLAVFAWGSLISIALQVLREAYPFPLLLEAAAIVAGLTAQYLVAERLQNSKLSARLATQAT